MRVSILAYDGCLAAEIFGLADVLLIANRIARLQQPRDAEPFQVTVIGVRGDSVQAAGGVRLGVQAPHPACDLLVAPAFDVAGLADIGRVLGGLGPEIAFLARAASRGPVAAVCGGAFLLGEAGLLAGRRATTAWAFAPELARRYPTALIDLDAMLVRDGPVTTTGAFSAAHDLAQELVRERAGDDLARALGKFTLLDGARASQAPYLDARMLAGPREGFSQGIIRWLEARLAEPYSLERLAAAFHVSSRTLLRRFKAETGRTPLEQLQDLRIGRAKHLLESTDLGLAQVAEQIGYLDLSTFSRLFARMADLTPSAYRRRFRPRAQLVSGWA